MGRKRTAEQLFELANKNGWKSGAHEAEDEKQHDSLNHSKRYRLNQENALEQWTIFMSSRGVDPSECFPRGCPIPKNTLLKDFARWYVSSRKGRYTEKVTYTSLRNILKKFYAGFSERTGTEIPENLRKDVYFWSRNTLLKDDGPTTKRRDKYLFDVDDLVNVLHTLWTEDDVGFIHEGMRNQMTFLILAYCFTGARVGAFLQNCPGTIRMGSGQEEAVVFQGLTGNEITAYEHGKLRFDISAFLLPLAFRDDVFIGVSSPAQLWELRIPDGENLLELRIKRSKRDLPVLRTVTTFNGLSDEMLTDSTFRYHFIRIVQNAGYYGELTVHSLRRAVANAIDAETATSGERNKVLGWASSDIGDRDYLSTLCRVPVQDRYLRHEAEKPHDDHVRHLRSVGTRRAVGLPQRLPAELQESVLLDPSMAALVDELKAARQLDPQSCDAIAAGRRLQSQQQVLKKQALWRWRDEWLDDRYDRIIQTKGRISNTKTSAVGHCQALFGVMPERKRLAQTMKSNTARARHERLICVQDLTALSTRNFEVLYRPGEEPINGACPVCEGTLPKTRSNRVTHIHNCRRKEFTSTNTGKVQYCYLCFSWFAGVEAWERHCISHLDSISPSWCAPTTYCHTLIRPETCPWCLTCSELPAAERLQQWQKPCYLLDHIQNCHISKVQSWPTSCGCGVSVPGTKALRYHLSDVHGIQLRARSLTDPSGDSETDKVYRKIVRENHKSSLGEAKFLGWSPSSWRSDGWLTSTSFTDLQEPIGSISSRPKKKQKGLRFVEWKPKSERDDDDHFRVPSPSVDIYPDLESSSGISDLSSDKSWFDDMEKAYIDHDKPQLFPNDEDPILNTPTTDDILAMPANFSTTVANQTIGPASWIDSSSIAENNFESCLDPRMLSADVSNFSSSTASNQSSALSVPDIESDFDLPTLESLLGRDAPKPTRNEHIDCVLIPHFEDFQDWENELDLLRLDPLRGSTAKPVQDEQLDCVLGTQNHYENEMSVSVPSSIPCDSAEIDQSGRVDGAVILPCQGADLDDNENRLSEEDSDTIRVGRPSHRKIAEESTVSRTHRPRLGTGRCSRATLLGSRIKCPICRTEVDVLSGHPRRMSVRQQRAFCRRHQLNSDKDEWIRRGYPTIVWRSIPRRLKARLPEIRALVKGDLSSIYREELKRAVGSREDHRFRCIDNAMAGYYGPRGQDAISRFIVDELGSEI